MVSPIGRRTAKGVQEMTLFKLLESGRCIQSPRLLSHAVKEGVGFDRLQMLYYYLKLSPLNIILCWLD
jgi:hypothetical protein